MAHLKRISILCLLVMSFIISSSLYAQLPEFLQGEWQIDKQNSENWQMVSENHLRGMVYKSMDNQIEIAEYLIIFKKNNDVVLRAEVVGQNRGQAIDFTMSRVGESYVFSNPQHDFPKQIVYTPLDENTLQVKVSGDANEFTYQMIRKGVEQIPADLKSMQNEEYDADLAKKLKADDYGMKSYFLVILTSGSATISDTALVKQHFRGHLDNISRLVDEQILVVAGPFGKNELKYRGLFIFQEVKDAEELKQILATDPAISSGLLDYLILPWYGSAALPVYLEAAKKISKNKP